MCSNLLYDICGCTFQNSADRAQGRFREIAESSPTQEIPTKYFLIETGPAVEKPSLSTSNKLEIIHVTVKMLTVNKFSFILKFEEKKYFEANTTQFKYFETLNSVRVRRRAGLVK